MLNSLRKAWSINWNHNRVVTEEEQDLYDLLEWPPWMETGNIATCSNCGYMVWEYISLKSCPRCLVTNVEGISTFDIRRANTLERLIHWWRADKKFTPVHASKVSRWK